MQNNHKFTKSYENMPFFYGVFIKCNALMLKRKLILCCFWLPIVGLAQPAYDACSSALDLCPNTAQSVNNIGATISMCSTCEDYFPACFTPINSIWLRFSTTKGGSATLAFTGVTYQPVTNNNNSLAAAVIQAGTPCDNSTYSVIACIADTAGDFSFNLTGLLPNTTYYVLVSGTKIGPGAIDPTEATMNVMVSDTAVDRTGSGVSIGSLKTMFCKGDVAEVFADTTRCPGQKTFAWYLNGSPWFTSDSSVFDSDEFKMGDQLTLHCNCFDVCPTPSVSNTITFLVLDFSIDAGADQEIEQGQSVELAGTTSAVDYYWSPPDYLSNPKSSHPIATPPHDMTYYFTATNGVCTLSDEMTVTVSPAALDVPSVFSPNGDGINDTWEILGQEKYPNMKVEVFDRWGQRVFQTIGYASNKWWDGKSATHKEMATSTYYYVIHLNDDAKTILKGPVTIMQ